MTKEQYNNALRAFLVSEGFNPDSDNAYIKQASYIAYFERNHTRNKNLRRFVKQASGG